MGERPSLRSSRSTTARAVVLSYLQRLKDEGTGLSWEDAITLLVGNKWSYSEHIPGDGASPDAYTLRILLPFGPAAPIPHTLNLADSGVGTLAAGTYYYAVAATTPYGETVVCATQNITVASSRAVTVTWAVQDPLWTSGYKIYRGPDASHLQFLASTTANSLLDDGSWQQTIAQPQSQDTSASLLSGLAKQLIRDITPAHLATIRTLG